MIGIFGGAFDPPHTQHVKIVREAIAELGLEKVVLVPSGNSPHKDLSTPFSDRVDMVRAAFRGVNAEVDEIENSFAQIAYSSDILPILKEKYGDIIFLVGGDSLLHFRSWHLPHEVLKVCPLFVIPRGLSERDELENFAQELMAEYGGKIDVARTAFGEEISSTELRAALELQVDIPYLDEEVKNIALSRGLYRAHSDMIERVKGMLTEKRWNHTCGVVLTGLKMNAEIGLHSEKVFTACLLHDCMKYAEDALPGVPQDAIGTKVMHAFNGAEAAKSLFGVTDDDIINAVRYHTTGRAAMSTLEKLVYVADMIEPNRTFDGVERLRAETFRDLDLGFAHCLAASCKKLAAQGKPIYHLTVECYDYYCKGEYNGAQGID